MDHLVKDTQPLSETFLPKAFPGREWHLKELVGLLTPALRGHKPPHVWLSGPPGSGKSSVARKALGNLEVKGVRTAYVNCWRDQTLSAVLETVFKELRALVEEKRDASFRLDRLSRITRDNAPVIALDEIDNLFLRERDTILYNLAELPRACLVCISSSREAYLPLDPRVQSRIQPHFVEFRPYTQEMLMVILEERAQKALVADSWCRQDLVAISRQSQGDARIAIQTLGTASYLAEKRRVPRITREDIDEGLRKSRELRRLYAVGKLPDHQKLIYQVVEEAGKIETGKAWRRWVWRSKEKGLAPFTRRTFQHQKKKLVQQKLLEESQERGRGNRIFLRVVKDDR